MSYTKGEWRYYGVNAFTVVASVESENDTPIVHLYNEDNARLIAAAPDLLKALENMLEWARRVKERNSGLEILNALNAIAKAEGTQIER